MISLLMWATEFFRMEAYLLLRSSLTTLDYVALQVLYQVHV